MIPWVIFLAYIGGCFLFDKPCLLAFHWFCAPPPTMESNFCWELTKRETFSPWLRWGYTTGILESRGEPWTLANPRSPVPHTWCPMILQRSKSHPLNLSDPQPLPSNTYTLKKGWVFVWHNSWMHSKQSKSKTNLFLFCLFYLLCMFILLDIRLLLKSCGWGQKSQKWHDYF